MNVAELDPEERVVQYLDAPRRVQIDMNRQSLQCMADGKWLRNEVIDIYLKLVVKRSETEGAPFAIKVVI